MIQLSDAARQELEAFFADKPKSGIRVYLAPGGCSGPRLALALDDPTDNDKSFEVNGFTFCVDSSLLESIGGVKIDVSYMGFIVEPDIPLPGGGGCSSCGGGCGGGCGSY